MSDKQKKSVCPREIKPKKKIETEMKLISQLNDSEINYLISRFEGVLCFIQDWNGVFCKSIHQRANFTVCDEADIEWVISSSFDVGYIIELTKDVSSRKLDKFLKSIDKVEGGYNVSLIKDGATSDHIDKTIAKAFSLALLKLYYSDEPGFLFEVPLPIRSHSISGDISIPGEKPSGITLTEFFS